jgi:hypothetical protein
MSKEKTRICGFCFKKFTYDELPEGSVVFLGICACKECLEKDETEKFRELVEETREVAA